MQVFAGIGWILSAALSLVLFCPQRMIAQAAPPDPKGGAPSAPPPQHPPEKIDGMFSLAGQAGLPRYLKCDQGALADLRGIRGGTVKTLETDFFRKDFTIDLVFEFPRTDDERSGGFVGIGENGREGNWIINSILVGLSNPGGDGKGRASIGFHRKSERTEIGAYGDQRGPHMLRMQKKGPSLTFALCANFDGANFRPEFLRAIPDLEQAAPYLTRLNSPLFFGGNCTFKSVRLLVDGKPVEAGLPADHGAAAVNGVEGLIRIAPGSPLPEFWAPSAKATIDAAGLPLKDVTLTSRTGDYLNRDFTLDVVYRYMPNESGTMMLGIGENKRDGGNWVINSVVTRIAGPGNRSGAGSAFFTFRVFHDMHVWGTPGKDHPGPNLLRMEKRGNTLMYALCVDFKDRFEPDFMVVVPSLSHQAPYLNERNAHLFLGEGGTIEQMRLVVAGASAAPAPQTPIASATPGAVTPPAPGTVTPPAPGTVTPPPKAPPVATPPATAPAAVASGSLFSVAGGAGLPRFLTVASNAYADADGLHGDARTIDTNLINRDFTIDLLATIPASEGTFLAGLGAFKPDSDRDRPENVVVVRMGAASREGNVRVVIGRSEGVDLGKVGRNPGPHLLRLEKRGRALTVSVTPNYQGKHEPTAVRTLPDVQGAAPFLSAENGGVFISPGPGALLAMGMAVDGTPLDPGQPADKGTRSIDGPENLINLASTRRLPASFATNRDIVFTKDGVNLKGKVVRTTAADFLARNFTFDVVLRFSPNERGDLCVGIGDGQRGDEGFPASFFARVRLPASDNKITYAGANATLYRERTLSKLGQPNASHMLRLQKRNDVLTLAVCTDYKGRFEPTTVRVLPSLKAIAPFLNPRNSFLFVQGDGGIVEQLRLVVEGAATESTDVVLAVPPRAGEGTPLRAQIVKPGGTMRLGVVNPPRGLTLSPTGELAWTPAADQVGRHELRISIADKGQTTVQTAELEVFSAADVRAAGGDLSKVHLLYKLPLESERHAVVPGLGNASLLVLEGNQLRRLNIDGISVLATHELPRSYHWIGERETYFVAMSDTDKCLDLIDKKTLKATRTIQMNYYRRSDLTLHPHRPVSYACIQKFIDEQTVSVVVVVDELSGEVREPQGAWGTWAEVSPDGRWLYAGYRETFVVGQRLLFNPGAVHVVPEYGDFCALLVYDLSGALPRRVAARTDVGGNGQGLVMSPDGKRIVYLSHVGYPQFTYGIAAWDPMDLTKRPISYNTKDQKANCKKAAFHPTLPIVAAPCDGGAVCFNAESGEVQLDRLDLRGVTAEVKVKDLVFSPDGRYLILDCDKAGERFLRQVPLKLSPQEAPKVGKPLPPVPPAPVRPPPVPPGTVGGPQQARAPERTDDHLLRNMSL